MLIKMNIESVLRSSSLMMIIFIIVLIQICCATSLDGVTLQFNKRGKHDALLIDVSIRHSNKAQIIEWFWLKKKLLKHSIYFHIPWINILEVPHNPGKWKFLHETRRSRHFSLLSPRKLSTPQYSDGWERREREREKNICHY